MQIRQHRKLQMVKSRRFSRELKERLLRKERFSKMVTAVAGMQLVRMDMPDAVELDSGSQTVTFTLSFAENPTSTPVV